MVELNLYKIEDEEYVEIDRIINNDNVYAFLANKEDPKDFCIRKVSKSNSLELLPLDTEEEFDMILKLFVDKHKALIEDL